MGIARGLAGRATDFQVATCNAFGTGRKWFDRTGRLLPALVWRMGRLLGAQRDALAGAIEAIAADYRNHRSIG